MTVKQYLEKRPKATYGKGIRILNNVTRRNMGGTIAHLSASVKNTKVTEKYIFIFI